jgi:peptidoglycan/LPS O-acetylase OafA/YrhL
VVAFHAGLPVPGGFVGVDVFFVISGFVITAMLQREWSKSGRIKFGAFYLKRFKRLAPALALMVGVTLMISTVLFSPFGHQTYAAATGIGAMLMSANFVIVKTTGGYFAPTAENNPLLNTWSLSVEEQFYLIFPALIALGWYLAKRRGAFRFSPVLIVGGVAIASFALTIASANDVRFPNSDLILGFYSPFTRAWEFAVGALLALALARTTITTRTTENTTTNNKLVTTAATAGILMLAASLWLITESTTFPGPWTLLPITGTLLLLFAGTKHNAVSQALSTNTMVKVGDWSYSIYLWHWPFIVFSIYLWPTNPYSAVVAALVSLAPALASYYWVEQPLRQLQTPRRAQVAKFVAIVTIPPVVFALAMAGVAKYYWQPQYLSGEKASLRPGDLFPQLYPMRYLQEPYFPCDDYEALFPTPLTDGSDITTLCGQTKPGEPIQVAILGDSHAGHLFPGLARALPDTNVAYYALPLKPPISDGSDMNLLIDRVVQDPAIKTVVVSAYWNGSGIPTDQVAQTLSALTQAGKQVFVVDDIPDFPFGPDQCKYGLSPLLPVERCDVPRQDFADKYAVYYPQLQAAVDQVPGVRLLNTAKYFCDDEKCSMTNNGTLFYADDDHLNHQGSAFLVEKLLADTPGLREVLIDK